MKLKSDANTGDNMKSIATELNYVMKDINSYDELTDKEKEIWTRESFYEVFE